MVRGYGRGRRRLPHCSFFGGCSRRLSAHLIDRLEARNRILLGHRPEVAERLHAIHQARVHHGHHMLTTSGQLLGAERDLAVDHRVPALRELRARRAVVDDGAECDKRLVRVAELRHVSALHDPLAFVRQTDRVARLRAAARALELGGREASIRSEAVRDRGDRALQLLHVRACGELRNHRLSRLVDRIEHEDRRRIRDDLGACRARLPVHLLEARHSDAHGVALRERCIAERVA